MKLKLAFCCFAAVLLTEAVRAQTPPMGDQSQTAVGDWGITSASALRLPAAAFTPRLGPGWDSFGNGERFRNAATDYFFDAPLSLPSGATITGLRPCPSGIPHRAS